MKKKCDVYDLSIVITIDGPSASGKSTVAKMVADKMKYEHLDTGGIYRTIAYWCSMNGWTEKDREKFITRLDEIDYKFESKRGRRVHCLGGKIVNNEIRTPEISQLASRLAVFSEVRRVATDIQRSIAKGYSLVVEGRDAAWVFPSSPVKIFLTATIEERAKRRVEELKGKYPDKADQFNIEETIKEIGERDERDRERKNSPLKKAIDAVNIDTTGLTINEVVKRIVKVIKLRKARSPGRLWTYLIGERRAQTTLSYRLVYIITRTIYRLIYRLKIYGEENFPCDDDCATIVAPNHASFLDPPAIGIACPAELHALGIDYLFRIPVVGRILPLINVHPVSSGVTDAGVLRTIVSLLKEGRHCVIFPEGSRSRDNELKDFKRGIGVLAALTKCSITPTYVDGVYEAWKRGQLLPKPWGKISVVFGKPVYWKDFADKYKSKKEAEVAISNEVKARIQELKDNFVRT